MTESADYAKKLIIEEHAKSGQTISGEIELIEGLP